MYNEIKITNQAKFDRIAKLACDTDYNVEFRPTVYRGGWPQPSSKPYLLQYGDGSHIAAFAKLEALEINLRGRAGC